MSDWLHANTSSTGRSSAAEKHALHRKSAQVLRILFRKQANRRQVTQDDMSALVRHLQQARSSLGVAAECASVISNLCHERRNVSALLQCGGVGPLKSLLGSADADVQASAAGALQSICFQVRGAS